MRLWSLHPFLLDSKGLVALWREALLAKKVLEGKTKGYINHPQLIRFKEYHSPLIAINSYLYFVLEEAKKRNYRFEKTKIEETEIFEKIIPVSKGQIDYELKLLSYKLSKRDKGRLKQLSFERITDRLLNPIFYLKEGKVEVWEKVKESIILIS